MRLVKFKVKGAGSYKASANGDPTCLDLFHLPQMHAFNGMLTTIVQSGKEAGVLELQVTAKGLKSGKIQIESKITLKTTAGKSRHEVPAFPHFIFFHSLLSVQVFLKFNFYNTKFMIGFISIFRLKQI